MIHGKDGLSPDDYQPMCRPCHFRYDDVSGDRRGKPSPRRGEPLPANRGHSWNGKLQPQDIRQIRLLLSQGMGLREIGRRFGVGHIQIAKIRDGKNWGWVR